MALSSIRKYAIHTVLVLAALAIVIWPRLERKLDPAKTEAGRQATLHFLQMVDQDRFAESWTMSAQVLREKLPQDKWADKLRLHRAQCGKFIKRQEKKVDYATEASGEVKGEFYTFKFAADYERCPGVTETVTVMLEDDGHWRVGGFFVE
ncbi:MAG: DUF4019 domain-containing protein [Deltaproteobacteria bacterium]|nr:MAG: DUF4019 domain-containing protein [Deltaproteobacteria bacterium]